MHKTTKEQLDTIARWTRETVAADSVAIELDPSMIEQTDDCDTWSSIGNSFGNLTVFVYDAMKIADAGPILRHLRQLGFRRAGKPEQDANAGTMKWEYQRGSYADDNRQSVAVHLTLKKVAAGSPAPDCQYVQIGVREVPDMKLLCGEELEAFQAERAGL